MASTTGVDVWDLTGGTAATYPILGARAIAFVDPLGDSHLAVATEHEVLFESGGRLEPRLGSPTGHVEIAAAGKRLWALASTTRAQLLEVIAPSSSGRFEAGFRAIDVQVPENCRIFGSASGDVWLAAPGKLQRISIDRASDDPLWRAQVAPVFQRVCAHCHLPGGEAGIDLSTPAAWQTERAELVRRVLVTRTMPPAGTELSDSDRAAVAAWLKP
jgi:mono/diheme cytochrome c family protein